MLTKKSSSTLFLCVSLMNPQLNSTPGNTQLPSGLSLSITHTKTNTFTTINHKLGTIMSRITDENILSKKEKHLYHTTVSTRVSSQQQNTNYSTLLQPSENCHRNSQGKQGNVCFIQLHIHTMPSLPDFFL
jgi:hypothetical protein